MTQCEMRITHICDMIQSRDMTLMTQCTLTRLSCRSENVSTLGAHMIHMCDITHICDMIHMCDMTHVCDAM